MSAGRHNAAIAVVWERQLPETRRRVDLLQRIARNLSETRAIDPDTRAEALDIAHKLAGSLGMFGFQEATDHARAIEQTLDVAGLPQPERLQKHTDDLAAALRDALET